MAIEKELLLDAWLQFSLPTRSESETVKRRAGGISVLEQIGNYLHTRNIIDDKGTQITRLGYEEGAEIKYAEIHKLELFECSTVNSKIIMRVPGGWIFYLRADCYNNERNGVFVPYNEEFLAPEENNENK